jgi:hypothetical protein
MVSLTKPASPTRSMIQQSHFSINYLPHPTLKMYSYALFLALTGFSGILATPLLQAPTNDTLPAPIIFKNPMYSNSDTATHNTDNSTTALRPHPAPIEKRIRVCPGADAVNVATSLGKSLPYPGPKDLSPEMVSKPRIDSCETGSGNPKSPKRRLVEVSAPVRRDGGAPKENRVTQLPGLPCILKLLIVPTLPKRNPHVPARLGKWWSS